MSPIGIFDSGFGGLTIFREIKARLPQYDYIYLGDNARAPYGNRSYETIHEYTWQCVRWLLSQGCPLVVLACNTASAKALRQIQQRDLPTFFPDRRVLGVIRPTAEVIGTFGKGGSLGILGTAGTVQSGSYLMEIEHFFPDLKVFQQACPLLVPMIEDGQHQSEGAIYFLRSYIGQLLAKATDMDVLLLACTHYPLMEESIRNLLPDDIKIVSQGKLVAESLEQYLDRHTSIASCISTGGTTHFYTTDEAEDFERHTAQFYGTAVNATQLHLN